MQITNRCSLCKSEEESCAHLMKDCRVTQEIWKGFRMGAEGVVDWGRDIASIISHCGNKDLSEIGNVYWELTFHAFFWGIWLERNKRIFEDTERSIHQIICDIRRLMWSWSLGDTEGRKIKEEQVMFHWEDITRL
ncbi:hypothetical protein ACHQM5_023662 [Ranunculus cassubicifolius]